MRSLLVALGITVMAASQLQAAEEEGWFLSLIKYLYEIKTYSRRLEAQAYVLDRDQVAELLADPTKEPMQKTQGELCGRPQYLVFQIINHGSIHVWGGEVCFCVNSVDVGMTSFASIHRPKESLPEYRVLPIGYAIKSEGNQLPNICYNWRGLSLDY